MNGKSKVPSKPRRFEVAFRRRAGAEVLRGCLPRFSATKGCFDPRLPVISAHSLSAPFGVYYRYVIAPDSKSRERSLSNRHFFACLIFRLSDEIVQFLGKMLHAHTKLGRACLEVCHLTRLSMTT